MIPKADRCRCEMCDDLRRKKEERERPQLPVSVEVYFVCVNASFGGTHCKTEGHMSACKFCKSIILLG